MAKKQKLVDLDSNDKAKIAKVSIIALATVAIACCILVGCFACTQAPNVTVPEMTPEQKATYWKSTVDDVLWTPTNDDVLDGLYYPSEAKTYINPGTGNLMIYFLLMGTPLKTGKIILSSESGDIDFGLDGKWSVKCSEKNEKLFMTVTDSNGVIVYYEQK